MAYLKKRRGFRLWQNECHCAALTEHAKGNRIVTSFQLKVHGGVTTAKIFDQKLGDSFGQIGLVENDFLFAAMHGYSQARLH